MSKVWKVDVDRDNEVWWLEDAIIDDEHNVIAYTANDCKEGDAALIAAAPELYAALVLAEQTILGQAQDYGPHDWRMRVLDDRLPTIRAALEMVKP